MEQVSPPALAFVGASATARCLDGRRADCVDVVRRAYLLHDRGDSVLPHSCFLRPPGEANRSIALPAYLGGEFEVSGVKWIASYPGNIERGLPRASAVLLLNDVHTGFPFACLEASAISAARTAASAVLAAEAMIGRRVARRVGFVGAGLIACTVWQFLRDLGWDVAEYQVFDVHRSRADGLADVIRSSGACAGPAAGATDVFDRCDLVVLATTASHPYLSDPHLLDRAPTVLHLSLRDLAPPVVLAGQNFTDDVEHAVREDTSLHLTEQATGHRRFVDGTLADLLTSRVRRRSDRAALFAPFGLGVLDLAVGKWLYDLCAQHGTTTPVVSFFSQTGAGS